MLLSICVAFVLLSFALVILLIARPEFFDTRLLFGINDKADAKFLVSLFVVLLAYGAMPLFMRPITSTRLKEIDADIQEIDFQNDLQQFAVPKEEIRAEKILRINELQLRRYYNTNLNQNWCIFFLGVACIFLGVLVICSSLYLVHKVADTDTKVIFASLGAVGSVLINCVAAIYLRMNTSASQNLAAFHARLVDTHQLLLANLLASRIEDRKQRWTTLAEIATGLTGAKGTKAS